MDDKAERVEKERVEDREGCFVRKERWIGGGRGKVGMIKEEK